MDTPRASLDQLSENFSRAVEIYVALPEFIKKHAGKSGAWFSAYRHQLSDAISEAVHTRKTDRIPGFENDFTGAQREKDLSTSACALHLLKKPSEVSILPESELMKTLSVIQLGTVIGTRETREKYEDLLVSLLKGMTGHLGSEHVKALAERSPINVYIRSTHGIEQKKRAVTLLAMEAPKQLEKGNIAAAHVLDHLLLTTIADRNVRAFITHAREGKSLTEGIDNEFLPVLVGRLKDYAEKGLPLPRIFGMVIDRKVQKMSSGELPIPPREPRKTNLKPHTTPKRG
ncbi:MAG: hypothetical protein HY917_02910 [Candidatus Diapherotrites archaeon]|nr:hypothetical protein [Candidatus Diapherotrites archaeon]